MSAIKIFVPDENYRGGELTVRDVIDRYLNALTSRVRSDDYDIDAFENSKYYLESFAAAHSQEVSQCRQADLNRWLDANQQWRSMHTRKNAVNVVVTCFSWAADEERGDMIRVCPYRRPNCLKGIPYVPRRPADHAEYVILMRKGSRPLRRALFFLRRTGARTCEMRELIPSDCILDVDVPHLLLYRHKSHRKTRTPRVVGIDAATARWLGNIIRNSNTKNVFTNCDGGQWDRHTFARHLRRWAKRLGLDEGVDQRISGYCLRHTFTVDGIEAGISSRQLADQLGHARTDMVDLVYGRHTRARAGHLGNVVTECLQRRRRKKADGK